MRCTDTSTNLGELKREALDIINLDFVVSHYRVRQQIMCHTFTLVTSCSDGIVASDYMLGKAVAV